LISSDRYNRYAVSWSRVYNYYILLDSLVAPRTDQPERSRNSFVTESVVSPFFQLAGLVHHAQTRACRVRVFARLRRLAVRDECSLTDAERETVAQRGILHSCVKRRHVRGDTPGFWIIPRTPQARNKFSDRAIGGKGKGERRPEDTASGENLAKYPSDMFEVERWSFVRYIPEKDSRTALSLSRSRTYFTWSTGAPTGMQRGCNMLDEPLKFLPPICALLINITTQHALNTLRRGIHKYSAHNFSRQDKRNIERAERMHPDTGRADVFRIVTLYVSLIERASENSELKIISAKCPRSPRPSRPVISRWILASCAAHVPEFASTRDEHDDSLSYVNTYSSIRKTHSRFRASRIPPRDGAACASRLNSPSEQSAFYLKPVAPVAR